MLAPNFGKPTSRLGPVPENPIGNAASGTHCAFYSYSLTHMEKFAGPKAKITCTARPMFGSTGEIVTAIQSFFVFDIRFQYRCVPS
jgi:hypothetical protein